MNRYLELLDLIFITLYIGVMLGLYHLGRLPDEVRILDLVLIGLAAARLTDVISTDEFTRWLREPFIRIAPAHIGDQEVETREGRGSPFKRVIGDLLSCPWCVGVWVAAGLTYLFFLIPQLIWLFILVLAVAEIGSLVQMLSTLMVGFEKYLKVVGEREEEI